MFEALVIGAWLSIIATFIIALFLAYREVFKPPPLTFLELFMYMEDMKETMEKIAHEEARETREKIFQLKLKDYDRIRELLEKYTPNN